MLGNYFKVFFRTLAKHKFYSLINVAGLALGMASCLLILQHVRYEMSFDSFWTNADRIFRIRHDQSQNGVLEVRSAQTFPGVGGALASELPEVQASARFIQDEVMCYTADVRLNNQNLYWIDPDFFKVFSLPFESGPQDPGFRNFASIIVSRSAARKLFGNADPMGRWFRVNEGWAFCVTGVIRDFPANSHLKMDFIAPMSSLYFYLENWDNERGDLLPAGRRRAATPPPYTDGGEWRWINDYTYILLSPGANPNAVAAKLPGLTAKYMTEIVHQGGRVDLSFQPVRDIHLSSRLQFEVGPNGDRKLVLTLLVTAFIILIMAWVNCANLSIGRAMDRARETALRKVVGAGRGQLVRQFVAESMMINALAMAAALPAAIGLDAVLARIYGAGFVPASMLSPGFWGPMAAILLAGTALSGFYPAMILSSFKPADLFKKELPGRSGHIGTRKLLVAFQFLAAIVFVSMTFVAADQVRYMRSRDLGARIDQVLFMRSPYTMIKKPQRLERLRAFKAELERLDSVEAVATSSSVLGGEIFWHRDDVRRRDRAPHEKNDFAFINTDEEFVRVFGLKILAGRNFLPEGQDARSVILNEEAVRRLGYTHPADAVDDVLEVGPNPFRIVGVVADYHHESLKRAIRPILHFYGFQWRLDVGFYSVRIRPGRTSAAIDGIHRVWKELYPEDPFDYDFVDQAYGRQYASDRRFELSVVLFSGLSLGLTCFGLVGLMSYATMRRSREIGIRKVLGASGGDIYLMLNREFAILLGASFIAATPLCLLFARRWLDTYAYRIGLGWTFVLGPGLLVALVVFGTLSLQASRAARSNPAISLRSE